MRSALLGSRRGCDSGITGREEPDGTLRRDFAPQDIPLRFWASDRVIDVAGNVAPEVWRRQFGFVVDGLRSDAATPRRVGNRTAEDG